MRNRVNAASSMLALAVMLVGAAAARCAEPPAGPGAVDGKAYRQAVDRAIAFLRTHQATDGSYAQYAGPGVTAAVTVGLLRQGLGPQDPTVAKSLKYLESKVQPDGGLYEPGGFYRNYETCLAIVALKEANRDGRYDKLLEQADHFIKREQWDESEGIDRSNEKYGGAGYGKHKRPDLSNTSFLMDALRAAGNSPDDEAVKKALVFVSRCQNLETPHNTTKFSAKNPDGGFYYTPADGGVSMAGTTPDGGLRSYGSMTYSGLRSMIYAGLEQHDPRVKAALEWIQDHYDVKSNPGMGDAGLYYYYHTFAKTLEAADLDVVEDAKGAKHPWRQELVAELLQRQRPDGSWLNSNTRWLEGEPSLVTGYVLMTLAYCRPDEQ